METSLIFIQNVLFKKIWINLFNSTGVVLGMVEWILTFAVIRTVNYTYSKSNPESIFYVIFMDLPYFKLQRTKQFFENIPKIES